MTRLHSKHFSAFQSHSVLSLAASFLLLTAEVSLPQSVSAEEEVAEGISGTVDKKRRAPVIVLNPQQTKDHVKILVDAYVPNTEYEQYPIKFDFYINRHFFVSQVRSKELPGAIGIDIGPDVATPPFNYSIIATLMHPNRQFVSMAQGAIYAQDLSTTLNCTLTESATELDVDEDSEQDAEETADDGSAEDSGSEEDSDTSSPGFTAEDVSILQTSGSAISGTFTGKNTEAAEKSVSFSLTLSETLSASGTVTIEEGESIPVTGTAEKTEEEGLVAFTVSNANSSLSLECGQTSTEDRSEENVAALFE
jgi:hypothetical protein